MAVAGWLEGLGFFSCFSVILEFFKICFLPHVIIRLVVRCVPPPGVSHDIPCLMNPPVSYYHRFTPLPHPADPASHQPVP